VIHLFAVLLISAVNQECFTSTPSFTNPIQYSNRTADLGVFTCTWSSQILSADADAITGFSDVEGSNFNSFACTVRFSTTNVIEVRNGDAYSADVVVPYVPGDIFEFRMRVSILLGTYTVFVTPPGGTETLLASDFAFRTDYVGTANLANIGLRAIVGSHTVCDFRITEVEDCAGNILVLPLIPWVNPCEPDQIVCSLPDLNQDGFVNVVDFLILLANWGELHCDSDDGRGDIDNDRFVGVLDMIVLLAAWPTYNSQNWNRCDCV